MEGSPQPDSLLRCGDSEVNSRQKKRVNEAKDRRGKVEAGGEGLKVQCCYGKGGLEGRESRLGGSDRQKYRLRTTVYPLYGVQLHDICMIMQLFSHTLRSESDLHPSIKLAEPYGINQTPMISSLIASCPAHYLLLLQVGKAQIPRQTNKHQLNSYIVQSSSKLTASQCESRRTSSGHPQWTLAGEQQHHHQEPS